MKRRGYLVVGLLLVIAILIVVNLSPPSPADYVACHVLRYTNDASGLHALVQFTNSHRNLAWTIRTEFFTNGTWMPSKSEPAINSYPPMLPAKLAHMNVWVPVPPKADTWRVALEVRQHDRGFVSENLSPIFRKLRIRDPFYPPTVDVKSQQFQR